MAVGKTEGRWAQMSQADAAADDLAEGALLIAAHEYPDLDVGAWLQRLQELAATLRRRLRPDITPAETLIALNHYLFDELGFRGNAADYYDPRNSYLNDVIDRRLGIPISLSVLYIAVGRCLGLPLEGLSFPSHFLVKCALRTGVLVLDPYGRGASLGADDLRRRLGGEADEKIEADSSLLQTMLRTASTAEILARMLRNLRAIYLHHGDVAKALWAADRILSLLPDAAAEYRERGLIYLELECVRAALSDFVRYAQLAPQAADAEGLAATIADLQQRAARLN
jgi:regulator of sirC expression with transglutaminase-like and TPR domain